MGKYSSFRGQTAPRITRTVHPIWRGIGFVFMVVAPFIAYFTTILLLEENAKQNWYRIPRDLIASGSDPNLYMKIIGTITIVFLLYAFFMLITFFVYRIFGPSKLGPLDAPQTTFRGKKFRR